jgi:hypothetical protein
MPGPFAARLRIGYSSWADELSFIGSGCGARLRNSALTFGSGRILFEPTDMERAGSTFALGRRGAALAARTRGSRRVAAGQDRPFAPTRFNQLFGAGACEAMGSFAARRPQSRLGPGVARWGLFLNRVKWAALLRGFFLRRLTHELRGTFCQRRPGIVGSPQAGSQT